MKVHSETVLVLHVVGKEELLEHTWYPSGFTDYLCINKNLAFNFSFVDSVKIHEHIESV